MNLRNQATPKVKRFKKNTRGKDWFCTDVHGSVELLEEALFEANFSDENDRLFLGGDIIDRGPESHLVANILNKPYVHAIAGNHEQMVIDLYANGEPDEAVLKFISRQNGFGWWMDISRELRYEILTELSKLPLVIELDTPRGKVGILHAEVPRGMHWDTFLKKIEEGDPKVIDSCLWGRKRHSHGAKLAEFGDHHDVESYDNDGVTGIDRVFVGHNPGFEGIRKFGNVYGFDSAAVFGLMGKHPGGKLSMANVLCQTTVLSTPKKTGLIDVRDEIYAAEVIPFGKYSRESLNDPESEVRSSSKFKVRL